MRVRRFLYNYFFPNFLSFSFSFEFFNNFFALFTVYRDDNPRPFVHESFLFSFFFVSLVERFGLTIAINNNVKIDYFVICLVFNSE